MTRGDYCDAAKEIICRDRNNQYGEPEDNFQKIADLWSAYLGQSVTALDVGIMMTLFKIGRMATGKDYKADNVIDAIGYLACAGGIIAPSWEEFKEDGN